MNTRLILPSLYFLGFACASPVTLTNKDGKSIEVTIVSATEADVTSARVSDGKEFTIALNTLNNESVEIVDKWVKMQSNLPTEKKSHKFELNSVNKSWSYTLEFNLPKYDFGCQGPVNGVIGYSFDVEGRPTRGQMRISSSVNEKFDSVEKISMYLDGVLDSTKKSYTPKQLEENGELLVKYKVDSNKFSGYYLKRKVGIPNREYMLTDGKVFVSIRLMDGWPGAPINNDNIEAIISTMEVTSFKSER